MIYEYWCGSVLIIPVPFKPNKQITQFTWRHICIYFNISSVFINVRNVSSTLCTEIKKHVVCSMVFETLAYFKSCKRYCRVRQATDEDIIRRMRCANNQSAYLKLFDLQKQQQLSERSPNLRYKYIMSITLVWIGNWTKTPLPAFHVNSWFNSLHTTTCSADPDYNLWIS
jgi:hypothetical protein